MGAPVGNQFAVGNSGGARPDTWRESHVEDARRYALLGLTHKEMAVIFKVSGQTFRNWQKEHDEFDLALKEGSINADAKVASRLYHRAIGYEHESEEIHFTKDGDVIRAPTIKHYPPETVAGIFWLKNRRRNSWRDRVENVQVDADGNPLRPPMIVIVPPGANVEQPDTDDGPAEDQG